MSGSTRLVMGVAVGMGFVLVACAEGGAPAVGGTSEGMLAQPVAGNGTAPVAVSEPVGVPSTNMPPPADMPSMEAPLESPSVSMPGSQGPAEPQTPGAQMPAPVNGPDEQVAGSDAPASGETMPSAPNLAAGDLSDCAQPPSSAPEKAIEAWRIVNELRLSSGSPCMNLVPALTGAAQGHCDYLAANRGMAGCGGGHSQVEGCTGFTGASPGAREVAAGYPRRLAYTEVLTNISDNPAAAVRGWVTTPFHRIPILDPWTTDMGWGGAAGCSIIDFGRGMSGHAPDEAVVVYPYDGQTDVPLSFNGLESPAPPKPASGWPSAYPVSIYARGLTITEHVVSKEGDGTPLDHVWLDRSAPEVNRGLRGYFASMSLMYVGEPFEPSSTYRVHMVGSSTAGPLDLEWTFTTGEKPTRPWGF